MKPMRQNTAADPGYHTLTPEQVQARLESRDEIYILDLREPREFHAGHLPEAILLPADDFADRYSREVDPEDAVILVCAKGMTSEAAARFLAQQGFTDVSNMAGGMAAWNGPLVP